MAIKKAPKDTAIGSGEVVDKAIPPWEDYSFPNEAITVRARNMEEALAKLAEAKKKDNK